MQILAFEDVKEVCVCCEESFNEDTMTHTDDGLVCDTCLQSYIYCEDCNDWYEESEMNSVIGDKWVCDKCLRINYRKCNDCGEYFDSCYDYGDDYINLCQSCYENDYFTCGDCGCVSHMDNAYSNNNGVYCEGCYEPDDNDDIHDYSYKPEPIFHGNESNPIYMGFELEVDEGGKSEAYTVNCELNSESEYAYCKKDCSLYNGFEIVTHPCTLNYHKSISWDQVLTYLKNHGYKSHDTSTCGLHVHIDRIAFGDDDTEQDLNIMKLLFIVEKYWDNFVKFSRRTEAKLNEWAARYTYDETNETIRDLLNKAKCAGRYQAVNLENYNTIEIRIFRGTLNYVTLFAALELCEALTKIVNELNIDEVRLITWDQLCVYFNEYDELKEYLVTRSL